MLQFMDAWWFAVDTLGLLVCGFDIIKKAPWTRQDTYWGTIWAISVPICIHFQFWLTASMCAIYTILKLPRLRNHLKTMRLKA